MYKTPSGARFFESIETDRQSRRETNQRAREPIDTRRLASETHVDGAWTHSVDTRDRRKPSEPPGTVVRVVWVLRLNSSHPLKVLGTGSPERDAWTETNERPRPRGL